MLTATIPFQWSGHILYANRTQLREALIRPETSRAGVYILVGQVDEGQQIYIGESDVIGQRIRTHDSAKDWWTEVLFISSSGEQLNKAHIRYLESRLVERAKIVGKAFVENSTAPNCPALSEAAKCHMENFLENIYLVMPALRFDFMTPVTTTDSNTPHKSDIISPLFEISLHKHGVYGTAYVDNNGKFVVQKGAQGRPKWCGGRDSAPHIQRIINDLINNGIYNLQGKNRKLEENFSFNSPSAAAATLTGRSSNGQTEWKIKGTKTTYKEWEASQIEDVAS